MIRIATKNDIYGIKEVENRCFLHPWTQKMIEESFESGCVFVVAEEDNQVIGYAGIYQSGDITNIAVLPEYRGRGFGILLVEEVLRHAKSNGIQSVFLEVRRSNAIAIKLYEKCGFKQISQRKRYYEDGEDALIFAFGGV